MCDWLSCCQEGGIQDLAKPYTDSYGAVRMEGRALISFAEL